MMPPLEADVATTWFAFALLGIGLVPVLAIAPRSRAALSVVLLAYVLRATAALVNAYVVPVYPFDADWIYLEGVALDMADGGLLSWLASIETGREFYAWLVAFVYLVAGRAPLVPIAANVVLGTATVILVYAVARELGASRRRAWLPTLVAAVFPSLIAYCIQPSREPLIALCVTAAVLGWLRWFRTRRFRHALVGVAALLLAGVIHSAFMIGLILSVGFALGEYLVREWRSLQRFAMGWTMAAISVAGLGVVAVTGLGLGKIGFDVTRATSLAVIERVTDKGDLDARGGYVRASDVELGGYADVVRELPRRIGLFVLKPYPWEAGTVADAVGVLIAAVTVAALIGFVVRRRSMRRTRWLYLAVFLSAQLVMFSWGTVNYGTAARHKSKFVPLMLVLIVAPVRHADVSRRAWTRSLRVGPSVALDRPATPPSRGDVHA